MKKYETVYLPPIYDLQKVREGINEIIKLVKEDEEKEKLQGE